VTNQTVITALNEAFNRELSTAIRYLVQGSCIRGRQNQYLRKMYLDEVSDEMGHARYLAEKIAMLGDRPDARPDLTAPPTDIETMIDNDLAHEEKDVTHYTKLAELADSIGDIDLKMKMEEHAADEFRHAEEFRRMRE
jgi:bacterioferritin